jgi:hypothetical protein
MGLALGDLREALEQMPHADVLGGLTGASQEAKKATPVDETPRDNAA